MMQESSSRCLIDLAPISMGACGAVYSTTFTGLEARDKIGMTQIMFETDYPHADSTFPTSLQTARDLVAAGGLTELEAWQFVRGNAIACYGLERNGFSSTYRGT